MNWFFLKGSVGIRIGRIVREGKGSQKPTAITLPCQRWPAAQGGGCEGSRGEILIAAPPPVLAAYRIGSPCSRRKNRRTTTATIACRPHTRTRNQVKRVGQAESGSLKSPPTAQPNRCSRQGAALCWLEGVGRSKESPLSFTFPLDIIRNLPVKPAVLCHVHNTSSNHIMVPDIPAPRITHRTTQHRATHTTPCHTTQHRTMPRPCTRSHYHTAHDAPLPTAHCMAAVGGWWRLAVVGGWRLVAAGGWRRLVAVGSGWRLAVGHCWRLAAVGGGWWLVVPWGGP